MVTNEAKAAKASSEGKAELPKYKTELIDFVLRRESLTITPEKPRSLKSKRMSPHFLNSGMLDDGESVVVVGRAYAQAGIEHIGIDNIDVIFGPPYKGIPLSAMTAGGLHQLGYNKRYAFYRKEEKTHGEGTGKGETKEEAQKRMIIGRIGDGAKVVLVDDVITTGGTKVEAAEVLNAVANGVEITGGLVLLDRQELNEEGKTAITELAKTSGIQFHAVLTLSDVIDHLAAIPDQTRNRQAILDYETAWGTPEIRVRYGLYQKRFIVPEKSIIPACDVRSLDRFEQIVSETDGVPSVGAYKIPALSGGKGWATWAAAARKHTRKPLILDGQKFGNDIPDTGRDLMLEIKDSGIDAVILFPFTGPRTQVAWTGEAMQAGLTVLVGAEMTHPGFLREEGGSIPEEALPEIYQRAARQGVTHYVFPGNKPEKISRYINLIRQEGVVPEGFSPGFVAQGGKISEAAKAAEGINYHAIVGRGIYESKYVRAAAEGLAKGL